MQPNRVPRQFTANLQSSLVSFTTHDDKEYLSAPCVALVPGVLNGDLVTLDSISDTFRAWNGRPVVLNHPYGAEGQSISANSPDVLATVGLGAIWNTNITDNKLRVDVWLDLSKCQKLGGDAQRVVDMVKHGQPLEVSTGYWGISRPKKGVYNNKEYDSVTELIIPDHLAMLPNAVGACNWGDGCGIPRTNQQGADVDERTIRQMIVDTIKKFMPNMTATDKFQALATLIGQEFDAEGIDQWRWHMVDIEENYVVIGMDNMLKRREFSEETNGNLTLLSEWETVHQQTTFVPVANQGMCDACTAAMNARADLTEVEEVEEVEEEQTEETEEIPMPEAVTQQAEDTLTTFLNELGATKEDIKAALDVRVNRRKELGAVLKENAGLTDEDIAGMTDSSLEKLSKGYDKELTTGAEVTDQSFVGRGLPANHSNGKQGVPVRPSVLIKKAV